LLKIFNVKSILRIITELNIWVALAVTSLCSISFLDLRLPMDDTYLLLVFFGTITMYNFQRLIRMHVMVQEVYHLRARWYKKMYKWNWIGFLICLLPTVYFGLQIRLDNYIPLVMAAIISLLYPLPVYKSKKGWMRLRDFPFFKIILVSLVWAIVTLWIPRQLLHLVWDLNGVVQFVERFLFIFAITIPFDIRDMKYDKQLTIPKILGLKGARLLSIALWCSFMVLFLWNHTFPVQDKQYYFLGIPVFIAGYYLIRNSNPQRDPLYFSFWIESLPIIQCTLYLLFLS